MAAKTNSTGYLARELASAMESMVIAQRNHDGVLYDLWRELGYWIEDPRGHQQSPARIERLVEWAYDGRCRLESIEATIDELKAELN